MTEPDGTPRSRKWMGEYGEKAAADFLRAHGCRILARNFKGRRGGEVDIIARDGKLLLFVEATVSKIALKFPLPLPRCRPYPSR